MADAALGKPSKGGVLRRASTFMYRHPRVRVGLLLAPGLAWLLGIYVASLATLLVNSFYALEDFTGLVVKEFTLETYKSLLSAANIDIIVRTVVMAAAVTVACAILAFPIAYFMARFASSRVKPFLFVAVLVPLWSSYLVRVYAMKLILAKDGVLIWFLDKVALDGLVDQALKLPVIGGPSLSTSYLGMFIVFVYIWLPFMILPLEAALERVPRSFIDASSDLGARPHRTFRSVIFPLAMPGLVAGSIFTFSLTLGDFIIPTIIGNSSFFIGAAVYVHQGTAGNLPLAAAFAAVPVVVMAVYLWLARRTGAFEAL
jgi:putative spermidine/putrescine transport system permease protein